MQSRARAEQKPHDGSGVCVCVCVFSSWAYLLVIEEQIKQASIALLLRVFWFAAW